MNTLYRSVLKPVLFRFDPERIHDAFVTVGERMGAFGPARRLMAALYDYRGPDISKTVDGITYRTPVLLSAGFDTDGRLTRILGPLGFGGEEIGSITASPCAGNPKPRLTRLIRNESIVVYKGLRNEGVHALIDRLQRTPRDPNFVRGISIARTNSEVSCGDVDAGIADYVASFRALTEAGVGDYYTINISCPNSFGGEAFTRPDALARLLPALDAIPCEKPVYYKMPINVTWDEFAELLALIDAHRAHGVVIGNLNKDYAELDHREDAPDEYRGGLSGKPCFARSNELIRKTRDTYGTRFTIFGVGGILTADDACAKFEAGADLVQLITGMIFNGPGIVREVCDAYVAQHREVGE